ncbi:hypothetical protein EWH99_08890 [Sporolactobacillus sp. THM7-7]|nr:hypothetical protein EWH99_08890 [Sporolactobacillus sp. THM7-7]
MYNSKETKVRTNFPLDNVKQHQVDFLNKYHNCGRHSRN